jgi:hypothetical protein
MSHRSNGGIYGPQNRSTPTQASGIWHLYDEQQSVQARNWYGLLPTIPQVLAGTATTSGSTGASVPFTLGFNGGAAVTKVTVTSIPGNIVTVVTGSPPSSPVTVSGLSANTTYQFQVVATNSAGDSTPSYTNSITTPSTYSISYLVVGGGGGSAGGVGGTNYGSAGAGSTVRTGSTALTQSSVYTVTVGNGGAGSTSGAVGSGQSSSVSGTGVSVTATGGSGPPNQGRTGGSNADFSGGTFSTGVGSGGGAGGGANGSTYNGGNGAQSSISGSNTYYGGGGAGNNGASGSGTPGLGGGGSWADPGPTNGGTNTGGGGGAGNSLFVTSGGSGIVVLSIPTANYTGTVTGSPTVTTVGGNKILTFTGSGSYTA